MKRIFIILCALALVCCSCIGVLSVSAEEIVNGRTVINYRDYITGYDLEHPDLGWAYLYFSNDMCGSMWNDKFGQQQEVGIKEIPLTVEPFEGEGCSCSAYWPGASISNTFLDLSNIPNGSRMAMELTYTVYARDYQTELNCEISTGLVYYGENFNLIRHDYGSVGEFVVDGANRTSTRLTEIPVNKPEGAEYVVFYAAVNFVVGRSNDTEDITISCAFMKPTLKISTSYTSIIIDSIVNAQKPEGSGSIGDLGNAEDALLGNASDGVGKAEQIVSNGSSYVLINGSGFLFLTVVFDKFANLPFFTGLLYVSLGLGIFSFLCNIATSLGRRAEGSSKQKGGKG